MVIVTRTINPLPFEHLEPKRFEDLIRQLAYEYRPWRKLEATGSSGSDDGYDIRGWEIVSDLSSSNLEDEDEPDDAIEAGLSEDRIWLIQCKREKAIGPTKLGDYVDAIPDEEKKRLHGLIIAASCNVSKKARDVFIDKCRKAGISECDIWSRAEIEDMLFQPKNDGILFAYFGISLTIRRRSVTSKLRSRLATKRKLVRAFNGGELINNRALFLDPNEEKYPYSIENVKYNDLPWKIHTVEKHHPLGIMVVTASFLAYLDDDGVHWDAANSFYDYSEIYRHPWADDEDQQEYLAKRNAIFEIQNSWPQQNRASLTVTGLLKYEDILEIDKDGDTFFRDPVVYVEMRENKIPFSGGISTLVSQDVYEMREGEKTYRLTTPRREVIISDGSNRVEKFPKEYRIVR